MLRELCRAADAGDPMQGSWAARSQTGRGSRQLSKFEEHLRSSAFYALKRMMVMWTKEAPNLKLEIWHKSRERSFIFAVSLAKAMRIQGDKTLQVMHFLSEQRVQYIAGSWMLFAA